MAEAVRQLLVYPTPVVLAVMVAQVWHQRLVAVPSSMDQEVAEVIILLVLEALMLAMVQQTL